MKELDVGFVNPFIDGVIHVLKVQCGIECQPGKPFLNGTAETTKADIAGILNITSPKFVGSISICFPAPTFLFVMSKMFGEEYSQITEELQDGAGEVLNMVYGFAKRNLNDKGYALDMARPTVVHGSGVDTLCSSQRRSLILPFKVNDYSLYMRICKEQIAKGG